MDSSFSQSPIYLKKEPSSYEKGDPKTKKLQIQNPYVSDGPKHRVDRVARLFLQSSELGLPSPPHPQTSVSPPPLFPWEGTHSLAGEGMGGCQFGR